MKTIHNLLLFTFAALILVGCKNDKGGGEMLTLSETTLQMSKVGDVRDISLNASGPWKAVVSAEGAGWLTVSPSTSAGGDNRKITVTTGVLEEGQSASATIEFSLISGSKKVTLTVSRGDVVPGRKTDSMALIQLYNSTKGEKWFVKWKLDKPMNEWNGVKLTEIGGEMRVYEVVLNNNGLNGTLPESMQYMTELVNFAAGISDPAEGEPLPAYGLTGEFPNFLAKLPKLQTINVSNNRLEGTISADIFKLPLLFFTVSGNQLSGELPANIGDPAATLEVLQLQRNRFSGSIPASLSKLVKLTELQLANNQFSGEIPPLSDMKKLYAVTLNDNAVYKDEGTSYPDKITRVVKKYVSGGFTGSVDFVDMPELKIVLMSAAGITKSPTFKNTPLMNRLTLNDNPMMKVLDPSVFELESLVGLWLQNCGLEELPENNLLKNVIYLILRDNNLKTLPTSIGNMVALQEVLLDGNQLEALPDVFDKFPTIRFVLAGYNKLTTLPASFWTMTNLYSFELQCNEITDEFPAAWGWAWRNLSNININVNKFSGSIEPLTRLANLRVFWGSYNNFSGTFPASIKAVKGLQELTLDDNNIEGTLPPELGELASMTTFHINNNLLTGAIPSSLENLRRWCDFEPALNILPQKSGVTLSTTKECK